MSGDAMRQLAVRLMVVAAAMIPVWAVVAIIGGVVMDLPIFIIVGVLVLPVGIGFVVVACRRLRTLRSGEQSADVVPPGQGSAQGEALGREPDGYHLPAYGTAPPASQGAVPRPQPYRPAKGETPLDLGLHRTSLRLQTAGGTVMAVAALLCIIIGAIHPDTIMLASGVAVLVGATLVLGSAQVLRRAPRRRPNPMPVVDPHRMSTGAVAPPAAQPPMPTTPATPVDRAVLRQEPPGPRMQ